MLHTLCLCVCVRVCVCVVDHAKHDEPVKAITVFEEFFAVLNGLLATVVCVVSVDALASFEAGWSPCAKILH